MKYVQILKTYEDREQSLTVAFICDEDLRWFLKDHVIRNDVSADVIKDIAGFISRQSQNIPWTSLKFDGEDYILSFRGMDKDEYDVSERRMDYAL